MWPVMASPNRCSSVAPNPAWFRHVKARIRHAEGRFGARWTVAALDDQLNLAVVAYRRASAGSSQMMLKRSDSVASVSHVVPCSSWYQVVDPS